MKFAAPRVSAERSHDHVRIADWVEINLLLGGESSLSVIDLADEFAGEPMDESAGSERRFADDDQETEGYWERAESRAEDAFIELAQRARCLGASYPLVIDGDTVVISEDAGTRECYRFLVGLRARHLYHRALGDDGAVAGLLFERLAEHAVGAYIGANPANRVRFGVAGGSRGSGLSDDVSAAVGELATLLAESIGEVPEGADGDFGADVIAWKPFPDKRPGQLVVLGQATISEGDWLSKEPARRWTVTAPQRPRLIEFLARPVTAVAFVETLSLTKPETLRGITPDFSSIPMDRIRLLSVVRDCELPADLRTRMRDWVGGFSEKIPRLDAA